MPVRQIAVLLGLFGLCLAIVGIAWVSGSELYLYLPGRRRAALHAPPTHPGEILGVIVAMLLLTFWQRQVGVILFMVAAASVFLGSLVGYLIFNWTPSWTQHCLGIVMVVTSTYAWQQKHYFED